MNLASALLKQIIEQQDFDTWGNLRENYLPSEFQALYKKIADHAKDFNTLPSFDDLKLSTRPAKLKEQLAAIEAIEVDADAYMLLEYLKNEYTQVEILHELDRYIDNTVAIAKAEENVDSLQKIVLDIGERVDLKPPEESMQTISLFDSESNLSKYLPLGLNDEYDQKLKFTPRDLILIGGRRGAGKSLTCVNIANNVFASGRSAIYFTIEMDSRAILQRLCSLGARVPIGRLATRNLAPQEWNRVVEWWASRFVDGHELLPQYYENGDFDAFHKELSRKKLTEDRQLDVIYDPILTLSKIRTELETKLGQHQDVGVIIVDYLNQVKRHNLPGKAGQYDWTEQIEVSKTLKSMAQEYEVPVVAPYQIDNTGEARFAKGILDAADAAYTLETWETSDECITFNCTKMRSAKMEGFTSVMDWETLKIGPQSTMNPKERDKVKESLATGEDINDAV